MTNIIGKTETAEVLEAAADLLQDVGWCQGVSWVRDDHSGEVTGFCSRRSYQHGFSDEAPS